MSKLFFFSLFLLTTLSASSQSMDRYAAINYFLSVDSVKKMLLFDNNKITWLQDTDSSTAGKTVAMGYPGNYHFKWTTDSSLQKPLKAKNCALYFVTCTRKGEGWLVEIMQACSNLVCQGEVKKTKEKMMTGSIVVFAR